MTPASAISTAAARIAVALPSGIEFLQFGDGRLAVTGKASGQLRATYVVVLVDKLPPSCGSNTYEIEISHNDAAVLSKRDLLVLLRNNVRGGINTLLSKRPIPIEESDWVGAA